MRQRHDTVLWAVGRMTLVLVCLSSIASGEREVGKRVRKPSECGYSTESVVDSGERGGRLFPNGTNFTKAHNREMGAAMEVWNAHRWREGVEMFKKILRDHPESPWAAEAELHIGCYCKFNGQYDEAESHFLEVMRKYPGELEFKRKALYYLPHIYFLTGRYEAAQDALNMLKDLPMTWQDSQYYENWSRSIFMARNEEEDKRDCGSKSLALAVGIHEARGKIRNAKRDGGNRTFDLVMPAPPPEGYSMQELADASDGQPCEISYETLTEMASEESPVLAYLEVPAEPAIYTRNIKAKRAGQAKLSGHFFVVQRANDYFVEILDPSHGLSRWYTHEFKYRWKGRVILLGTQVGTSANVLDRRTAGSLRGTCCGEKPPDPDTNCKNSANGGSPSTGSGGDGGSGGGGSSGGGGGSMGPSIKTVRSATKSSANVMGPAPAVQGQPSCSEAEKSCDDTADPDSDEDSGCGCGGGGAPKGSPGYKFGLPTTDLFVMDRPIWYPNLNGPALGLSLAHHRVTTDGMNQYTTNVNFSPFGIKWAFNYGSYLLESPASSVRVFLPSGAVEEYIQTNGGYIAKDVQNPNTFVVTGGLAYLTYYQDKSFLVFNPTSQFLVAMSDRFGNRLTLNYQGTNRLTNVVDSSGRYLSFQYNAQGYVTNVSDMIGRSASFRYSTNGNLLGITDMGGYESTLGYAANQWITNIVYPNSSYVWFRYTNGLGMGWPYDLPNFTNAGSPAFRIQAVNSLGLTNLYIYHALLTNGGMSVQGASGDRWLYGLAWQTNSRSELIAADCVNEHLIVYPTGSTQQDGHCEGHIMNFRGYDAQYRLVSLDQPTNLILSYNAKTNSAATNLPLNRWTYDYDSSNRVSRINAILNGITNVVWTNGYDNQDHLVTVADTFGNKTTYGYTNDNISAETNALGFATHYGYDSYGNLTSVRDALSSTISFTYSTNGLLTAVTAPDGTSNSLAYDSIGRLSTFRDATGYVVSNQYDALDHVTKVIFPDGTSNQFSYECCGLEWSRDRMGRQTAYARDILKRVVAVTNAQGTGVQFGYAPGDFVTSLAIRVRGQDQTTRYGYTSTNGETRLTRRVSSLGRTNAYDYTFRGWLRQRVDAKGVTTGYSYDWLGRLLQIDYNGATTQRVYLRYDLMSRLTNSVDWMGTNTYSYDALGRITTTTARIAVPGVGTAEYRIAYFFDPVGNVTSRTLAGVSGFTNAITTVYEYDAMNRPLSVSNSLSWTTYDFDSAGRLAGKTYGNGDSTRYGYDIESRLTSLVTTNGANAVQGWTYGYNAMGMITNVAAGTNSWAYDYDAIYQLTLERHNVTNVTAWEYDEIGNRLTQAGGAGSKVYGYDADNELVWASEGTGVLVTVTGAVQPGAGSNKWYNTWATAKGLTARVGTNSGTFAIPGVPVVEGTLTLTVTVRDVTGNEATQAVVFTKTAIGATETMQYDLNGNLTNWARTSATNGFEYDMENRLSKATSNGTTVLENWYDGFGRRVAKSEVVNGQTNKTMYVYDGWTVLAVLDGNGQIIEYYTRGVGIAGDIGSIVAETKFSGGSPTNTYYYHCNHRGDVTAVRDTNGTTLATWDYRPFGEERSSTGGFNPRNRFSSKEYDASVGLSYFGYRVYWSQPGRWLTQDPLKEAAGWDFYTFSDGNPINFFDHLGLIGSPGDPDSPTRAFWEAMRRGDWQAARDILDSAANVGRATPQRVEALRKGIDRAETCAHELKRLSKLSRKELEKTLRNREKTLADHLGKPYRNGVDDPETIYIRQQIQYIEELLGIPQ